MWLRGLTRIVPNYCAFKGVIFGSNKVDIVGQCLTIGAHGSHFNARSRTRQTQTPRPSPRYDPTKALQPADRTSVQRLDSPFHFVSQQTASARHVGAGRVKASLTRQE